MKPWILFFIFIVFASLSPSIDLSITRFFYENGTFSEHPFFTFLYNYSERPAQLIAILGLVTFSLSFFIKMKQQWRLSALYLFLTLAIGAFVITELTFKNNWGRPRPRDVIEFGGTQAFRPFYSPNISLQNKSFPCGHCTTGFYFFAFAFLTKRQKLFILLGLTSGSLIGLARIAQGGHFFTDVFFGGLIMWVTAWGLHKVIFKERLDERADQATS